MTPFGKQGNTGDHIEFFAQHLAGCKAENQDKLFEIYKKAFRDAMFLKEPQLIDWSVIFTYAPWDPRFANQRSVHKVSGCRDGREWGLTVGIIDVAEVWNGRRTGENFVRRTQNIVSRMNPVQGIAYMLGYAGSQSQPYLYGKQKWHKYWGRSSHLVELLLRPLTKQNNRIPYQPTRDEQSRIPTAPGDWILKHPQQWTPVRIDIEESDECRVMDPTPRLPQPSPNEESASRINGSDSRPSSQSQSRQIDGSLARPRPGGGAFFLHLLSE